HVGTRDHRCDHANECSCKEIAEGQVRQLVVDVAVHDDEVGTRAAGGSNDLHQMQSVEQIEAVAQQGEIPLAHILIAAIDRLVGRADAALAAVDLVDEALAIAAEDDHVVPEGKELGVEVALLRKVDEVDDLRAFSGTVDAGEGDEQRFYAAA